MNFELVSLQRTWWAPNKSHNTSNLVPEDDDHLEYFKSTRICFPCSGTHAGCACAVVKQDAVELGVSGCLVSWGNGKIVSSLRRYRTKLCAM